MTPCDPVEITADPSPPPEAWRAAIEELRGETRREGMPWSCTGGALSIRIGGDGRAVLHLRDPAGHEASRHVSSALALLPTAEALLAEPSDEPRAPPPPPPPPAPPARPALPAPPRPPPPSRGEPRFLIDVLAGARYGGPSRTLWFAPELRATVPIQAWSVGVWARFGLPAVLDAVPSNFTMLETNIGLSAGRRLLAAPIELRALINPSFAVVSMEGDTGTDHDAGARIALRIGLGLQSVLHLTDTWRGLVAIDGELAPAELVKSHRITPELPPLPAFGAGLSIGVEAVVP